MTGSRPKGPYVPVDDEWRSRVGDALEDLGWSQADLADKVGVTPGAISQLLTGESKTSRVATKINEVLQIAPTGFPSMAMWRAYQKISEIAEQDPRSFLDLLEKIDRHHANLEEKEK